MLVLSRKTRQQIRIGENITVTILLVKGQVVRVGIEAPRDVRVLRAELPVYDESPTNDEPEPVRRASRMKAANRMTGSSEERAVPRPSAPERRVQDATDRTSPGLVELRRRGSLASLTRASHRGSARAVGGLFERH